MVKNFVNFRMRSDTPQPNETNEKRYRRLFRENPGQTIIDMDLILDSIDPLDRLGEMLKEQGVKQNYIDNTVAQLKRAMKKVKEANGVKVGAKKCLKKKKRVSFAS